MNNMSLAKLFPKLDFNQIGQKEFFDIKMTRVCINNFIWRLRKSSSVELNHSDTSLKNKTETYSHS